MSVKPILKTQDAFDLATRIIEDEAGALFPIMDVRQLEEGSQTFSVSHAMPDGTCQEIDSCSGPGWKECAVSALAGALWESRECWNTHVASIG